jgi:hypothetical protein
LRCDGCGRLWSFRDGIYDFKNPSEGGAPDRATEGPPA